jgi:hypothetical protein
VLSTRAVDRWRRHQQVAADASEVSEVLTRSASS